ncbi:expansin EXLX1 family cellulose-binding protein [Streptomyces sp. NRRL S-350]|uniref:expansin EXLX1 family cellulose-binding protein n=1 Tax=Streptomyces sp. NRRL S-350 TaxID=1463902 RepID=UPI0004BF8A8D|nr:expansin EXLX1 family cellulose-binding protein [Streptomyces sp. NRRL S-350]
MRATKHAAPQPKRGLVMGIPLALVAAAVLACLAFALLPGSGGGAGSGDAAAGQPAAASVATTAPATQPATEPATPPDTGAPAGATPTTAAPSADSAPPSAPGTPSRPATPTRQSSTAATPSAPAASAPPTGGNAGAAASTASLAGRIKPGTAYQGVATSYDAADGNGACSFGPSGDLMVAAMNHTDYESSKACGASVLVRAANGASITVRIVNECPLPCAPGQLDLSHEAFAKLAELSVGRLPVTWTLLSPATAPDTMSIRYQTGSSQWWCGIQAIGHRNPVATLEVRAAGGWRQLPRSDYNYFLSADGTGCGGQIRVTDIYGEQLTVDGIALRPAVAQSARAQFARH